MGGGTGMIYIWTDTYVGTSLPQRDIIDTYLYRDSEQTEVETFDKSGIGRNTLYSWYDNMIG